jgi:hypothetical protein
MPVVTNMYFVADDYNHNDYNVNDGGDADDDDDGGDGDYDGCNAVISGTSVQMLGLHRVAREQWWRQQTRPLLQ